MKQRSGLFSALAPVCLLALVLTSAAAQRSPGAVPQMNVESQQDLVNQYCAGCHNEKLGSGGFS